MNKLLQSIPAFVFILIATVLEAAGDAIIRKAMYNYTGATRIAYFLIGASLVIGYGTSLNLAPVEFGKVVGLYISMLFIVWQIVNFISFKTIPTPPILIGGALIVIGGMIITFWK